MQLQSACKLALQLHLLEEMCNTTGPMGLSCKTTDFISTPHMAKCKGLYSGTKLDVRPTCICTNMQQIESSALPLWLITCLALYIIAKIVLIHMLLSHAVNKLCSLCKTKSNHRRAVHTLNMLTCCVLPCCTSRVSPAGDR